MAKNNNKSGKKSRWVIWLEIIGVVVTIIGGIYAIFKDEDKTAERNIDVNGHKNAVINGDDNRINSDNNTYIINGVGPEKGKVSPGINTNITESPITNRRVAGNRLAILPFENSSNSRDYGWLSAGLAESLIETFSENPNYTLIEGNQRDKILKEIKFQQGKYVDITTAVRVGKLLGASQVVIGSFQVSGNKVLITSRIVDVELGLIQDNSIVTLTDSLANVFEVQKRYNELTKKRMNDE